jgi:hypothetical protein
MASRLTSIESRIGTEGGGYFMTDHVDMRGRKKRESIEINDHGNT